MNLKYFPLIGVHFILISCLKTGDGQPQPPLPPPSNSPPPTTATDLGRVVSFHDTLKVYNANTGNIIALSNHDGTSFGAWNSDVIIDDSLVYQFTYSSMVALNLNTGARRFSKVFGVGIAWRGVSTCIPIIDGPYIYVGAFNENSEFKLWCVDKLSGVTIWESTEALTYDTPEFMTSLAQTDKSIIVNTYAGPACFDKATGKLLWRNEDRDYKELSPKILIAAGKMFCVSYDKREVFAFDVVTGQNAWRRPLDNTMEITGPMQVYNNTLYVTQGKHTGNIHLGLNLVPLDISTGQPGTILSYPDAAAWIYLYQNSFYTLNNVKGTLEPTRLNKHDLATGNILWTKDFEGSPYSACFTPDFIYFSEVEANTTAWQKLHIIDPSNGSSVKVFPWPGVPIRPIVIDRFDKVYYFQP